MVKLISSIVFLVFVFQSQAQLLDTELEKYGVTICKYFKTYKEIDSLRDCNEVLGLIYSRELPFPVKQGEIKYYEIGLTSSHSYKFIGILTKKEFRLLESKNFAKDYDDLVAPMKGLKSKIPIKNLIIYIDSIKKLYDYNSNPPWKK